MTLINPAIRNKLRPGPNPIAYCELILALHKKPMSRKDIVEQVGICEATTTRWLNLLKAKNLIYVVYWRYAGGQPVAHWMFGYMQESAPRPKPKTSAEMCREWRKRQAEKKELDGAKINAKRKGKRNDPAIQP